MVKIASYVNRVLSQFNLSRISCPIVLVVFKKSHFLMTSANSTPQAMSSARVIMAAEIQSMPKNNKFGRKYIRMFKSFYIYIKKQ